MPPLSDRCSLSLSLSISLSLSLSLSLFLSLSHSLSFSTESVFLLLHFLLSFVIPHSCHCVQHIEGKDRRSPLLDFKKISFSLLLPPFFSLPPSLSFSYSFRPAHTFAPLTLLPRHTLLPRPTLFPFLTLLPRPSNVSSACKCPLPAQKSGLSGFIFVRRGWTFTRLIVRGDAGFSKSSFKVQSSKLERVFYHVSLKRDVRALSFEL